MAGKRSIKQIAGRLLSRWYVFVITLCIALPLAFAYIKFTPKEYVVKASVLLNNGGGQTPDPKNPIKTPAAKSESEIEDAVGILKSYTMVEQAIKGLDFGISYFTTKDFVTTEQYENASFKVEIDSMVNQVVDVPIYIRRISSTRYQVKASAKTVKLYNYFTHQVESTIEVFNIDEEVPLDKSYTNKYLSFKIKFKDNQKTAPDAEMFFILKRLQSVTEEYQQKLTFDPVSADSRIIDLHVKGHVAAKEKAFLSKLLDVYLTMELNKENELALKTIEFIDNQLNSNPDTLTDRVHNYLIEKRMEAKIALASNAAGKAVLDKPYIAGSGESVYPDVRSIYVMALIGSVLVAVGFVGIKDLVKDNIITSEDVEQITKIPFIGTISHASKREQSSIVAHARSPVGESFRSLRVNLQYLTLNSNASVIGITSSRESEGKTFCSVNLAAVMAYSGRRTVLVDTDMRRPRVAAYFQLENRKGLSNFLVGDGSIKEIINNTEHKGFDVIGSGPIPPNPVDLIGNARMEELINTLKQSYSTIILDSPPLGYVSEYIILMKYTDANLYIVRSDYTNRNSLKKINKLFDREKISNFSILLNDVKSSKASGNYYAYGYGYGYKY